MNERIGIIGAGVVGTAVGVVLHSKGFEVTGIYDVKPESTMALVERIGCAAFPTPQEVSRSADILFITTSDSCIQAVADELAERQAFHEGQVVLHMSGAHSSEILDKAKRFEARVLSVHPLQSFASLDQAIENLPGSVFSIEGDVGAQDQAVVIVKALGGEHFFIDRKSKPLYHAGACVVSNYLVTIVGLGVKLLEATGISGAVAIKALMPLITGTVNNIQSIGVPQALTGPVARGDLSTVQKHQECMEEQAPQLLSLYSSLGYYTADVARDKGTIDPARQEAFHQMFASKIGSAVKNAPGSSLTVSRDGNTVSEGE
ncbi:MAG TPA: Rossmann-like and DUF2520 domain-containing protein [Syntrophomonadaceae bacterium]|nr:Rossmann-like and DUF2520 domain-containing protein [Syntrophomonadaceae bacterium]